jgi:hypothetical protein
MGNRRLYYKLYLVGLINLILIQFSISQADVDFIVSPGESNGSIQFNNNGLFAGASAATIFDSTLVLGSSPSSTAPEAGSKLFNEVIAYRGFIKKLDAFDSYQLQPFMGNRSIGWAQPVGGGSTTVSLFSLTTSISAASTNGRSITTGNNFTQRRRVGYVTAASTNTSAYLSSGQSNCYISSGIGLGGFFFTVGFGVSDATFQDSSRLAIGLASGVPSASADPSNHTNCIMIGADALDTMLYLMHNDGLSTCTKTALGSDFRNVNSNTTWYKVFFYNPQGSSIVYYEVLNCLTRVKVTGSINSNLPNSSQTLFPFIWRNTGLIATACAIDWNNLYLETEY